MIIWISNKVWFKSSTVQMETFLNYYIKDLLAFISAPVHRGFLPGISCFLYSHRDLHSAGRIFAGRIPYQNDGSVPRLRLRHR